MKKRNSEFMKLKKADFWKGLIVSILAAGFTALSTAISSASDFASFNWQSVVLAAAGGFVAYIIKNFFTNSNGETFKSEQQP
jgi:membrane protein implicated in regulation of membrane protease activity